MFIQYYEFNKEKWYIKFIDEKTYAAILNNT